MNNKVDENINNALDDIFGTDLLEIDINNKDKKVSKKRNNKSIYIYIFLIILLLVIVLLMFIYDNNSKEKIVNCSYKANDKGYSITDEYIITYKENKIIYFDGKYIYRALNEEYKNQIDYVKDEKMPVIINSNGMPGFTYIYEIGEDYFSVNSYLDFSLFDYNLIDKNDNDNYPISYITIDSSTTYESLVKNLKKDGYTCTKSK